MEKRKTRSRAPNLDCPIRVDSLQLDSKRTIFVLRDDLLPAGTKQRAVLPLLLEVKARGVTEVVYASPFAGFAQIALAHGCKLTGIRCSIYCERDPTQNGNNPHAFSLLAEQWGAEITVVEDLLTAEELAQKESELNGSWKIPLGFQCAEFQHHFRIAINAVLGEVQRELGSLPSRFWLPMGSGTLVTTFHSAAPPQVEIQCVDVHVLPKEDPRIQAVGKLPRVYYLSAPEKFQERAICMPTIPSNIHYDAKIWHWIKDRGRDGDLWWNVAR